MASTLKPTDLRKPILRLLRGKILGSDQIYNLMCQSYRDVTEAMVHGTLIELNFEGLVKIDYQPICSLTEAGKEESKV